jgi:ABC-type glycerol-3-phosphate transport system substrate-binding protein
MVQQGPWFANYIYQNVHNTRPEFENDWAACPFPSDDGRQMVSWAATDTLAIPMGSKHPKEAFKFMCYVNRQDVMEELCMAHCKNSPLMQVSDNFIKNHPNHYIQLFEDLARSPNAFTNLDCPIAEVMRDEMNAGITEMVLMKDTPKNILQDMQTKLQSAADEFYAKQKKRFGT